MDSPQDLNKILETSARWRDKQDASSQRKPEFKTPSQVTVDQVYTPENNASNSYLADQGMPGEFPYLRGVHASGYRGRLWTMRMFAGFGRPEETNARFKFLLEQGQTGLSVAFDMPTLYGYDTDDPVGQVNSVLAVWLSLPWRIWRPFSMGSSSMGLLPP